MTGTPDYILTSKRPENESDPYNKDKKWGSKVIRTTREKERSFLTDQRIYASM